MHFVIDQDTSSLQVLARPNDTKWKHFVEQVWIWWIENISNLLLVASMYIRWNSNLQTCCEEFTTKEASGKCCEERKHCFYYQFLKQFCTHLPELPWVDVEQIPPRICQFVISHLLKWGDSFLPTTHWKLLHNCSSPWAITDSSTMHRQSGTQKLMLLLPLLLCGKKKMLQWADCVLPLITPCNWCFNPQAQKIDLHRWWWWWWWWPTDHATTHHPILRLLIIIISSKYIRFHASQHPWMLCECSKRRRHHKELLTMSNRNSWSIGGENPFL